MNGTLISADNSWALFAVLACVAAAAIYLEQHYRWAAKMTGCVLALLGSMLLINLHIIPTEAKTYDFIWDYIVPLSIPMLLFEADIRKIGKRSGRFMIVFLIGGLGTIVGGLLAYQLLRSVIPGLAKAVPMMIGTYTGGTINLVAMADNYHASSELVSAAVVADDLVMVVYLFILMAVPEGTFYLSLSRRKDKRAGLNKSPLSQAAGYEHTSVSGKTGQEEADSQSASYWRPKKVSLQSVAAIFALSVFIVAVSSTAADYLSAVIPKSGFLLTLLNGLLGNEYLLITTITMLLATLFPRKVGKLDGAQEIGTYLIHIFFAVIGVPASISLIVKKAPLLLIFCLMIVTMNMLFSFISGRLLHFNNEEIAIASNANTTSAGRRQPPRWPLPAAGES
ncbi:MAG: DUF819 family protein [Eubacteriales bacterium]|jgi:uncharacterized membrane protein